jgi:IS5 family transposase
VAGLEALGFEPYVAVGRERCKRGSKEVSGAEEAKEAGRKDEREDRSVKGRMRVKLQSEVGRRWHAARKSIVEPVFGQIKGVRGFRRFMLRGPAKVRSEWRLVCLTHNLLKPWGHWQSEPSLCATGAR